MELYILISNGGDGSYHANFVLDPAVLALLQNAYEEDKVDYEYCPGVDGDGFHYSSITVPEGSTKESLGIYSLMTLEDAKKYINE